MKKILIVALVLALGSLLWCDLQAYYKKGTIVLKAVPGFGAGNDYDGFFYDIYKDMVVAPDGSIFVANTWMNNVLKFDQQGRSVKKMERTGKGPGDISYPVGLTILDNRYLVLGEYSPNTIFSLWGLDGNYIKAVKTTTPVFYLTALRNNRVAYYFLSQPPEK